MRDFQGEAKESNCSKMSVPVSMSAPRLFYDFAVRRCFSYSRQDQTCRGNPVHTLFASGATLQLCWVFVKMYVRYQRKTNDIYLFILVSLARKNRDFKGGNPVPSKCLKLPSPSPISPTSLLVENIFQLVGPLLSF